MRTKFQKADGQRVSITQQAEQGEETTGNVETAEDDEEDLSHEHVAL